MARVRFTRDNTAVLLIDHQVGLFTGVRDIEVNELKHNVVALARAAQVLRLPIVAVTTARDSMWGPTIPELQQVLGDADILDRSTVNAWDDERSEEHTSELQSRRDLVCRLLLEKKKKQKTERE